VLAKQPTTVELMLDGRTSMAQWQSTSGALLHCYATTIGRRSLTTMLLILLLFLPARGPIRLKMALQSQPALVVVPVNTWGPQCSRCDPRRERRLKHECQSGVAQMCRLLGVLGDGRLIGGCVRTMRGHAQVKAGTTCTQGAVGDSAA